MLSSSDNGWEEVDCRAKWDMPRPESGACGRFMRGGVVNAAVSVVVVVVVVVAVVAKDAEADGG